MPRQRGADSGAHRRRRFAAAAVLSWIVVLASASAGHAEIRTGWAWQAQRNAAPSLGPVSGIPPGDLAVAWLGQPDKLAYLGIGGLGSGSFAGSTLELAVDSDATNLDVEGAQLRACLIVLEWEPAEPMAWDGKPPTVCETSAPGRYETSAEAFAFDLNPMADALASAAVHGISIEPAESPESSFQVVFKAGGIRLRVPAPQSGPTNGATPPAPEPVITGEELEAFAPTEARVPQPSPRPQPTSRAPTAVAAATQRRDESRPVSLSAVYGMVALFAGLALGGRVVAYVLRSRREDES